MASACQIGVCVFWAGLGNLTRSKYRIMLSREQSRARHAKTYPTYLVYLSLSLLCFSYYMQRRSDQRKVTTSVATSSWDEGPARRRGAAPGATPTTAPARPRAHTVTPRSSRDSHTCTPRAHSSESNSLSWIQRRSSGRVLHTT
jgi:hypothetical protein